MRTRTGIPSFSRFLAFLAAIVVFSAAAIAETKPQPPRAATPPNTNKSSGLFAEFARILQKTRETSPSPVPRTQSRLLPLLPESTVFYAAFPNYGEASHQFLTIFHAELKNNAELRNWWESEDLAAQGPKLEAWLQTFYELSQYLGDEVVVCAVKNSNATPAVLVLAEVRKPGLKRFLQQAVQEVGNAPEATMRVLDAGELAKTKDAFATSKPAILVLPNLVVGTTDLAAARSFTELVAQNGRGFTSSGFGQRLAQSYAHGLTLIVGINLQAVLGEMPKGQAQAVVQSTGFSEAKYLVWEHTNVSNQPVSQTELSFVGARHGVASWIAAPAPMESLRFVSPKAAVAGAVRLKDPAAIFDDVRDLATASNPNAFAALTQMESALKVSLKNDVLSRLTGEVALELGKFIPPRREWKVIFQAKDTDGLVATLRTLLSAFNMTPIDFAENGITYHLVQVPSADKGQQITYTSADGYLIIGSNRRSITEAVRLHRTGGSLADSRRFQESLPPGKLGEASALFYEDPITIAQLSLRRFAPEVAQELANSGAESSPVVICGYADESALRQASRSEDMDFGVPLIAAMIAIPNMLRAKVAASEASAAAAVRTTLTAQLMYEASYPERGFARSLAELGPDSGTNLEPSPQHAAFIDSSLGNPSCTDDTWCTKSGYRFAIKTNCQAKQRCAEYVVIATPANASTASKNYCAMSDQVVRVRSGAPLAKPITAAECQSWEPLH